MRRSRRLTLPRVRRCSVASSASRSASLLLTAGLTSLRLPLFCGIEARGSAPKRVKARNSAEAHVVDLASVVQEVLKELIGILLLNNLLGSLDHVCRLIDSKLAIRP